MSEPTPVIRLSVQLDLVARNEGRWERLQLLTSLMERCTTLHERREVIRGIAELLFSPPGVELLDPHDYRGRERLIRRIVIRMD